MDASYEAYRQCLINKNADFDACAREKAIFEADEEVYDADTRRQAAQPSMTFSGPSSDDAVANQLFMLNGQLQSLQGQEFVLQSQQNFWDMVNATRP